MSTNPYAPPTTAEPSASVPAAPLGEDVVWFSPRQVAGATFFGGPLAGGLLLRGNARAVQDDNGAKVALWGGIGGTVALLALALFVLPDNFPGSALGVATAAGAHSIAKKQWVQRVSAHHAPQTAATRRAVKITLLSMGVLLLVVLVVVGVGVGVFPDAELWQE